MDCMCRIPIVDTSSGFPLIGDVGSTHHTQKLIRDNECWMVIGWCKKLGVSNQIKVMSTI